MKLAGIFQDLEHLYDFQTIGLKIIGSHSLWQVEVTKTNILKVKDKIYFEIIKVEHQLDDTVQ